MATPSPQYTITLVHGTFAPNAAWVRDGSMLREKIVSELGGAGNVFFSPFQWRGRFGSRFNNSHRDRLAAGRRLQTHLATLLSEFPGAQHFVIGHSHGGNVIMYALRDWDMRTHIAGVVCMATPFIDCDPRSLSVTSRLIALYVSLGCCLSCFIHIPGGVRALEGQDFISKNLSVALQQWLVYPAAALCTSMPFLIYLLVEKTLRRWALAKQAQVVRSLKMTAMPDLHMLCLRVKGDEPFRALTVLEGLASSSFRGWNYQSYAGFSSGVFRFFIIITILLATLGSVLLASSSGAGDPLNTLLIFLGSFITIGIICITLSIILLLTILFAMPAFHVSVLALIPALFRSHPFSFLGPEALIGNLVARVYMKSTPDFCAAEDNLYHLHGPGLLHSLLYNDSDVIFRIAGWIRLQRECEQ